MNFVTSLIIISLIVAVIVLFIVLYRNSCKSKKTETFDGMNWPLANVGFPTQEEAVPISPAEPDGNEVFRAVDFPIDSSQYSSDTCFPRDTTTAEDLLPKDAANSTWAKVTPVGQGDISNQNFLTAGYMIGVNTIGQSLRNANQQLRSDIPNPRYAVGPWSQSTIEPDTSRRYFEIDTENHC